MQCSLCTWGDLGQAERIHKWPAFFSARLHISKQIISGERAMSVKRERKENISAQWHHSFGVEARSFYSHVLSNWHIPRSQSAPPPPSFCPPFLLHHFSTESSGVTQAESKGDRRGAIRTWSRRKGRGFGKQSREGRNFLEIPPQAKPLWPHLFVFLFRFILLLLSLLWSGLIRLWGIPEELYILFPWNINFEMWLGISCRSGEGGLLKYHLLRTVFKKITESIFGSNSVHGSHQYWE